VKNMTEEIEVIIEEGTVTFEIKGVKGHSCTKIMSELAKLGTEKERRRTREYYETAKVKNRTYTR
jgi:hypothetical protein